MNTKTYIPDLSAGVPIRISRSRGSSGLSAIRWTEVAAPDTGIAGEVRCIENVLRWIEQCYPSNNTFVLASNSPSNAGGAVADKMGFWRTAAGRGVSDTDVSERRDRRIEVAQRTIYVGLAVVNANGVRPTWSLARSFDGLFVSTPMDGASTFDLLADEVAAGADADLLASALSVAHHVDMLVVWAAPAFDDREVSTFVIGNAAGRLLAGLLK